MKAFALWIWQLPQNLVGLLFLLFIRGEVKHRLGSIKFYYANTFPGGITLGEYIIVGTKRELTVRHEFGHVKQSRILGPLYLLVIGLPSAIHAWLNGMLRCCEKSIYGYYHFYTEAWANKLGGLNKDGTKIR